MESSCTASVWSQERLIQMLDITRKRSVEVWKQLSVLSSSSESKDVNSDDRDAILTWIAKVNIKLKFQYETFFLAASILDRFILSVKAQPKYLKCIGISCLYLASKVTEEENVIPCTGELVTESDCGCSVFDVLRMERIILEKLSWNVNSSTALDYLHLFILLSFFHYTDVGSSLSLPRCITKLARTLAKLVCHYDVARFPDAAIALAFVSIELEVFNHKKWMCTTGKLQQISKVLTEDLMTCRQLILRYLPSRRLAMVIGKPVSENNSVPAQPQVETTLIANKAPLHVNNIAIKRKATSSSSSKRNNHSKKPHPADAFSKDVGNVSEASQELLSTSDHSLMEKGKSFHSRRFTYAEIVKYGHECKIIDVSKLCSVQANRELLSVLSTGNNAQRCSLLR